MRRDHVEQRKWKDVGYHYGIGYDGEFHILRPIDMAGSHCKGFNFSSIGIVLLGHTYFSIEQFDALASLLHNLLVIFDLKYENIHGHSDFNAGKTCPTFNVEAFKDAYL